MKRPVSTIKLSDYGIDTSLSPNALDTIERIISYCKQKGLITGNETDIRRLIESNNELELVFADLGQNDASIVKLTEKKYRITINSKHPPRRQRFSMAHEYAHYQLHRNDLGKLPLGEQIMYRNEERDPKEFQANKLAGQILMPDDSFIEVAENSANSASVLASKFNVSLDAARMRAKQFDRVLHD